jgi:preprotein translocase subunit YajC
MLGFWPLPVVILIFFVLIYLPSQKQKKEQQAMLDSLESGKEVVTTGGIMGTVVSVSPESLILRIKPDNVKLQVARTAVASVVTAPVPEVADKK